MRNPELWVFIFVLGLLGLSWPFLEIFHVEVVRYLFMFWLFLIALVAVASFKDTIERNPTGRAKAPKEGK